MVRALAVDHEVQVVAPVSWPVALRVRRAGQRWERARRADGIEVRHPVYVYPPKLLRNQYGGFFWWSIRRTVERMLRSFEPDVVIGYWAHPDGQAAVHVARRLGVPAVVMVGGTDILVLGHAPGRRKAIGVSTPGVSRLGVETRPAIGSASIPTRRCCSGSDTWCP
jgi:hypothetical protein